MQTDTLECPICFEKYDISTRLPRVVPVCGHTLCSQCIFSLLKHNKDFTCPIGKEVQRTDRYSSLNLDTFPTNYALRDLVEKSLDFDICKDHKKELQYVCVEDKVKVCHECGLFGEHTGHKIKPLTDLKPDMEKKIQQLEEILKATEECQKNGGKVFEEQKNMTLQAVKSRFKDLHFLLDAKEAEFASKIIHFYKQEAERFESQVGENSFSRKIIKAKVSEYQRINKSQNPFELLEEDLSETLNIIKETVCAERSDKINQSLEGIKLDINSTLNTHLSACESLQVTGEYLKSKHEEADLKLDEKLYAIKGLEKYKPPVIQQQANPEASSSVQNNDIIVKGNRLIISYPFKQNLMKNIEKIQEEDGKDNISVLEFKVIDHVYVKLGAEEVLGLRLMRSKLANIQEIVVNFENKKITDETLLDIFSCIFWKSESLKSIDIDCNCYSGWESRSQGKLDKCISFLAETVLPVAKNLKKFYTYFTNCNIASEAYISLSKAVSALAQNLTSFQFVMTSDEVYSSSLQKIFVPMPNLVNFGYQFNHSNFNDNVLEAFITKTLPSLKNVIDFQLLIDKSRVTDAAVKKLFNAFPEEWLSSLKELRVGLSNSNVSDEGLKGFVSQTLPNLKALETLEISTDGTDVSRWIKNKLSQWK